MASKNKKPASRGFVNNIILESLIHGDKYGYEIIKEVEDKSEGKILLKQPSLYSSLKRFESKGYITSYWGDSDIGGRRHYYTITEVGRRFFNGIKNGSVTQLDEEDDDVEELSNVSVDDVLESQNTTVIKPVEMPATTTIAPITSALDEWENDVQNEEDEDYDVFALLNKQTTPVAASKPVNEIGIQATMFTQSEQTSSPELMDEQQINTEELHETKLQNKFENDEFIEMEMEIPNNIPLIHDESENIINQENLTNKILLEQKVEAVKTLPAPLAEKEVEEFAQANHITSLEIHIEQPITNLQVEQPVQKTKPLKVIVDEFGILKSADDTLPRKPKPLIDNVGVRIESTDLVSKLPAKKQKNEQVIKFQIETTPIAEYNDQLNHLNQKINKAMETRKNKPSDIDFKNIMGELVVSDDEVFKAKPETTAPIVNDYVEEEIAVYEPRPSKNTSFASLQQSLKQNGFTFKPYECEINEDEKRTDFALVNKMRMHLGVILFLMTILQVTIFTLTLSGIGYSFKNIDYVIIGLAYFVGAVIMLMLTIPYFMSSQKRKLSNFNQGQNIFYGVLSLLSITIISYAVNSLFGLNFDNLSHYIVTLFMPILLALNCIIAPLAYRVLLNNKRYY